MKLYVSSLVILLRTGEVQRVVDEVHTVPSHENIAKVSAAHSALIGPNGAEARRNIACAQVMIDNEVRQSYEFPDVDAETKRRAQRAEALQRAARETEGASILAQEKQLQEQLAALGNRKVELGMTPPAPESEKQPEKPAQPGKPKAPAPAHAPKPAEAAKDTEGAALSAKAAGETKPAA